MLQIACGRHKPEYISLQTSCIVASIASAVYKPALAPFAIHLTLFGFTALTQWDRMLIDTSLGVVEAWLWYSPTPSLSKYTIFFNLFSVRICKLCLPKFWGFSLIRCTTPFVVLPLRRLQGKWGTRSPGKYID